jgi:hypothetical protein
MASLFSAIRAARRSRIACGKNATSMKVGERENERWSHLVLDTSGFHLVGEYLCTGLLRLCLVDIFHQYTLVLKDITLGLLVEGVIAWITGQP